MQPPTDQVYNMATAGDKAGEGETKTKKEKKSGGQRVRGTLRRVREREGRKAEGDGGREGRRRKRGMEGGGRDEKETEGRKDGRRREKRKRKEGEGMRM